MARLRLRPFVARDAAEVAAIAARAYPYSRWPSQAARAAYFVEIFLHNPWQDPELPSWVAQDEVGIVGFMGVLARRMLHRAQQIRVAVGCQLMVDPARPCGFAGLELLRRYFSGPQDLSVADGANEASRQCWEAVGGAASPLHSLHWVRLLRPAQGVLQLAASRPALRSVSALAKPFAALADACGMRLAPSQPGPGLREELLDAAGLVAALHEHRSAFTLRPHYEVASLEWLLGQVHAKQRRCGPLQSGLLRERDGRIAGWFLYYLDSSMSQVLQVGARRERVAAVLDSLFEHARLRGAVAIQGRVEPHLANGLRGKRCLLMSRSTATLVHARDPGLLVPFFRGDALFTRLDGEWWTRFSGDDGPVVSAQGLLARSKKQKLRPLPAS
jgi:hypothetical protein